MSEKCYLLNESEQLGILYCVMFSIEYTVHIWDKSAKRYSIRHLKDSEVLMAYNGPKAACTQPWLEWSLNEITNPIVTDDVPIENCKIIQ